MNRVKEPGSLEARPPKWRRVAIFRRLLLAMFVLSQTVVAVYYLLWILPYHGGTLLEVGIAGLFGILYAWIAVGFWTAVFGFMIRLFGGDRYSLLRRHQDDELEATPLARTAVILPIYHEPVGWTLSGLKAVYRDIEQTGNIEHFEFYILSDSRDPDVWLEEQACWHRLVEELGAQGRLFYRRRTVNLNYKSGNVADYLRRWGRRSKYMVVLDADSLLSGQTIVRMVRLMEREPNVGILQTNPTIINGQSLFARIQQFANRFYSTLFATGLAAVQMGEAAFWGHNAILRVAPFMKHCGLPKLRGVGLFGGSIMSHDFVEAAFMGRAGYEVWLEPELGQSFEESPPTLADELARDNRWSKGNLQHLWIMLFMPGLKFAHRMAFMNGIMAYLASVLWLCFLILTTIAAAKLTLAPIEYFPEGHQSLFPLWPEWRPGWALGLTLSTLVLLFFPKFLAVADAAIHRNTRQYGGVAKLLASVLIEIVISVLLAPVRMWAHSRYVVGALLNFSLSWAGQNRTDDISWRGAFATHLPGMVVGSLWSSFAWSLDPVFFLWSLPVSIPLVLAAPTDVCLSRVGPGRGLMSLGLLAIPEETATPLPVLWNAQNFRKQKNQESGLARGSRAFEQAVLDPRLNRIHQGLARDLRRGRRRHSLESTVAQCLADGPGALSRGQLSLLMRDRLSLEELHVGAWKSPINSYWGQQIDGCKQTEAQST